MTEEDCLVSPPLDLPPTPASPHQQQRRRRPMASNGILKGCLISLVVRAQEVVLVFAGPVRRAGSERRRETLATGDQERPRVRGGD